LFRTPSEDLPLIHFENLLASAFRNSEIERPPQHHFHFRAFRCSVVAPDHCIVGNVKNVIAAVYQILPRRVYKHMLNGIVSAALRENSLPQDKNVYNVEKSKVNDASFSIVFATFLVLQPCIYNLLTIAKISPNAHMQEILAVMKHLNSLVALLYMWPNVETEGKQCMDFYFGDNNGKYFHSLQLLAVKFSKKVSQLYRSNNPCRSLLDVPNLHRLGELVIHTIPRYGHVRHISDLTFEHKHQALKKAYQRGNNTENNNFALRTDVFDHWKETIGRTYAKLSRRYLNQDVARDYTVFLLSLLLGVRRNPPLPLCHGSFLGEASEIANGLFTPGLESVLKRAGYLDDDHDPTESSPWRFPRDSYNFETFLENERSKGGGG